MFRTINQFESIHDADIFSKLREAGLLPDDAHSQATDEGHHIAYFTNDADFVQRINAQFAAKREKSMTELRNSPQNYSEEDVRQWAWSGWEIAITPQRSFRFKGFEEV